MEGYNFFPCPSDLQFSFERNEEFERIPDTYPGPSHRREFVEQSASTSTSPSTGIIEASTSVASFNQKDRQGKKKAKYDIWSQSQTVTPLDEETSTREGLESELYLSEVFVFYV